MIQRSLLAAVILTLLILTPVSAAEDVTGKWSATFNTPIGEMSYTYDFVVKGAAITGTAKGPQGESPLTEGKVDGDTVTFVEMMGGMIRVAYTGKIVSADEIQFSRVVGDFGTEQLVAKRIKN